MAAQRKYPKAAKLTRKGLVSTRGDRGLVTRVLVPGGYGRSSCRSRDCDITFDLEQELRWISLPWSPCRGR
jgi:hypothetical protein